MPYPFLEQFDPYKKLQAQPAQPQAYSGGFNLGQLPGSTLAGGGFDLSQILGRNMTPPAGRAQIAPEVEDLSRQLLTRGTTDIGRLMERLGGQFGGSDVISSPRMRSQALLGGELGSNLLSQVLGARAQSGEASLGRQFQEAESNRERTFQDYLAQLGFGQQLDIQKLQAQLLPLQLLQMILGIGPITTSTGQGSTSAPWSFGLGFGQ